MKLVLGQGAHAVRKPCVPCLLRWHPWQRLVLLLVHGEWQGKDYIHISSFLLDCMPHLAHLAECRGAWAGCGLCDVGGSQEAPVVGAFTQYLESSQRRHAVTVSRKLGSCIGAG